MAVAGHPRCPITHDAIALADAIKRGAGEEAGATSSRLRGHSEACQLFSVIRQVFVKNRPQTTRLEHRLTSLDVAQGRTQWRFVAGRLVLVARLLSLLLPPLP